MREYTKHKIWRIRDLNEKYFEVVIAKGSLKYKPGAAVRLYNGPDQPLFIASGVQEAWVRLILNRDLFPNFDFEQQHLKLKSDIETLIPQLSLEESPNFLIDSDGAAAFFSFVSTFPNVKSKVCYLGSDRINEDWIKMCHKPVDLKKLRKAKDVCVIGNRDLMERKASKILNTCKFSYLL